MSHCAAPWVGRPEPRRPSCPSVPPSSPNNRFCQRVTLHCVSIVLLYTYPHNLTLLFAKHWLVGRRRFKKLHDLDNRCDRSHFKSSFSIFKEMFVKWVAAWGDGMGIGETRSCEHKEGDVIIHQWQCVGVCKQMMCWESRPARQTPAKKLANSVSQLGST